MPNSTAIHKAAFHYSYLCYVVEFIALSDGIVENIKNGSAFVFDLVFGFGGVLQFHTFQVGFLYKCLLIAGIVTRVMWLIPTVDYADLIRFFEDLAHGISHTKSNMATFGKV